MFRKMYDASFSLKVVGFFFLGGGFKHDAKYMYESKFYFQGQ